MKSFIVLAVLVALAAAGPIDERNAETLRSSSDNIGTGPFSYSAETSNGIALAAEAAIEAVPLPDGGVTDGLIIRGEYSWTAPDGRFYKVTYIADKDGYRAIGDHIA